MKTNILTDENPSVVILAQNQTSGSYEEQKNYKKLNINEVYLKNEQNFAFKIFNPTTNVIGVKISFNGNESKNSFLILKPGENNFIDRFIDEQKKMKFDTYFIDGSNDKAINAIKNNGNIKFEFFKENISYNKINYIRTDIHPIYPTFPIYPTYPTFPIYTTNPNLTNPLCDFNYTCNDLQDNTTFQNIETGRIKKGENSAQSFNTVFIDLEEQSFYTMEFKLLPTSLKENRNDVRLYCDNCNYRIRKENWLFCPKCGNKL